MFDPKNDAHVKAYDEIIKKSLVHTGASWGAVLEMPDGSIKGRSWNNRPCYGEMRRYGPESTQPEVEKPSDLPTPIPECTRLAWSTNIYTMSEDTEEHNELIEYLFDPERSPWRRGLTNPILYKDKQGAYRAVGMTDTRFDPTVLVNLLIVIRNRSSSGGSSFFLPRSGMAEGLSWEKAFLKFLFCFKNSYAAHRWADTSYYLQGPFDPRRILEGDAHDFNNGQTWYDGVDYNRPMIQDIFIGGTLNTKDIIEFGLDDGKINEFFKNL